MAATDFYLPVLGSNHMEVTLSSQVFKRGVGESAFIGDCPVEVLEIGFNYVRLKVTAPRDLLVCRGEVYESRRSQPIQSAMPIIPLAKYRMKQKTAA